MKKEPLFHVVKRDKMNIGVRLLLYFGSVIVALLIGSVFLLSIGVSPLTYYREMLTIGLLDSALPSMLIQNLIVRIVPLLITSVALSIAFKMRFWNVGGEGQFIIGSICAAAVAFSLGDKLPSAVVIILMLVAGALGGAVLGLIPAVLKVKLGTNETLMTLMLNYIALYVLYYFGETKTDWNLFLDQNSARPIFATFTRTTRNAWIQGIKIGNFTLSYSVIIAIVIVAVLWVYLNMTKHGYEISVVGDSHGAASYAGMNVNKVIVRTMVLSSLLIGFAGALFLSSSAHALSKTITNDVGWTGVVVAWLSQLNTVVIVIVSVLISVLQFGCSQAATNFKNVNSNFADMLQGIILFFVLAIDFFVRFKVVVRKKNGSDLR